MTTRRPPAFSITPRHLAILVILAVFAVSGVSQYLAEHAERSPLAVDPTPQSEPAKPATAASDPADITPVATNPSRGVQPAESAIATPLPTSVVRNQIIRDQSGQILFQGDIDLTPTLQRIERDERHPHRNDGGTFRNLEGRLPKKPSGYYKEYVHPTPETSGPGPQRVVLGQQGEIYYTPDHYQTFQRIP